MVWNFFEAKSQIEDIDGLNAIQIAGTNGKGGTCTFAASFLKAHGNAHGYPQKIGVYISPHMANIRRRICINGEPISKELFTTCLFGAWEKLPERATPALDIPRYLQFLAPSLPPRIYAGGSGHGDL